METLSFRTLEAIVKLKQLVDRATPKQVESLIVHGLNKKMIFCTMIFKLMKWL